MMKITRVLLGIDFIGTNFPAALYTLQRWWDYINKSNGYFCIVGISNFCDSNASLPGTTNLTPINVLKVLNGFIPKNQLVQWTSEIDSGLLEEVKKNGCKSQPFYSGFNYGSVINRLLILASSFDCDYMVRVDPGTVPPKKKSFSKLMHKHSKIINKDKQTVVSRRYADRLALRDMFVIDDHIEKHRELVMKYTGVNVNAQITGGAMLTFKTPGTPAICFPSGDKGLTLVWASDDGIFNILSETKEKSEMKEKFPVERFDEQGKPNIPR